MLLELRLVVDAVECAVAVQAVMAERNEGVPAGPPDAVTIGIGLGADLDRGDDILGDGVNVAAGLRGSRSRVALDLIGCLRSGSRQGRGRVHDLGEQSLKNIARPMRAYGLVSFEGSLNRGKRRCDFRHALFLVVLPFVNLGGDPSRNTSSMG